MDITHILIYLIIIWLLAIIIIYQKTTYLFKIIKKKYNKKYILCELYYFDKKNKILYFTVGKNKIEVQSKLNSYRGEVGLTAVRSSNIKNKIPIAILWIHPKVLFSKHLIRIIKDWPGQSVDLHKNNVIIKYKLPFLLNIIYKITLK